MSGLAPRSYTDVWREALERYKGAAILRVQMLERMLSAA
jgi:hypothetical protein